MLKLANFTIKIIKPLMWPNVHFEKYTGLDNELVDLSNDHWSVTDTGTVLEKSLLHL